MKLEVGMYVRFNWKKQQIPILIGKITEVHYDEDEKYYFYLTDNGLVIGEDNFVKEPSNNIIDLIEVGDYVNGYLVLNVLNFNDNPRILNLEKIYDNKITEEDIKSVVTKEQFESMKYSLEG